jgi:hypothetical protein
MQEFYRLMRQDGLIRITVPHPNHPTFQSDLTHVRAFTYETFEMINRAKNLDWAARSVNTTMVALMLDINFEILSSHQVYDKRWQKKLVSKELTHAQLREAPLTQLGVVYELIFTLRADKSHIGLVDATPPE